MGAVGFWVSVIGGIAVISALCFGVWKCSCEGGKKKPDDE